MSKLFGRRSGGLTGGLEVNSEVKDVVFGRGKNSFYRKRNREGSRELSYRVRVRVKLVMCG